MKFIELTANKKLVYVNPAHITMVMPLDSKTEQKTGITFLEGGPYFFDETPEEVMARIQAAK